MSDVIKLDDFPIDAEQDQIYEIIPDKSKIVASTNRLFNKYPTRYISAVPRFAIKKYSLQGDTVVDPFCGSGTTAIEAMLLGRNACSIDIDPFARLLIKVKTTYYSESDFKFLENVVSLIKQSTPDPAALYPVPSMQNLNKWFSQDAILNLSYLKYQIDTLCVDNQNIRDYLYVVLAGIIRRSSNADNVSPKPYISSRFPKVPENALLLFFKTEALYRAAIQEFSATVQGLNCSSIILSSNDAREIGSSPLFELGVTSPPYINAYDYVRSLKFEDIWLGLADETQLRLNRRSYVGTEISASFYHKFEHATESATLINAVEQIQKVDPKRANITMTYFEDMAANMISMRNSLKNNGHYVIVVGDSKIRGQDIPTAKILTEIAVKNGYDFDLSFKYVIRDRYLHLPRAGRGGIIKYDEILCLTKKSN